MTQTLMQRAFAAGELAPGLGARADLPKYQAGLRTCRNFIVRRSGGVSNRQGTRYLAETKASGAARAFLQPFIFPAADTSFAIECGDNYFRFFKNGAPVVVSAVAAWSNVTTYVAGDLVVSAGVNYYCLVAHLNQLPPNMTYWYPLPGTIYEIPTPYASGAFQPPTPACFSQSGLLIEITHLNYAPRELRYIGDTRWVLSDPLVTGPSTPAPSALAWTAGTPGPSGGHTYAYVVTAAAAETYEESDPCAPLSIAGVGVPTDTLPNLLAWAAVAGAPEYYVYCDPFNNGIFGYVGTAAIAAFNDTGFVPDFSNTPPIPRLLFGATNAYPAVSAVYQQRRIFAGSHTDREKVFASQTGFYDNFSIRSPLQEDDAVTFTIASDGIQPVHHLIGLRRLVLLTDAGEWIINGDASGTLTPTGINPEQHGYVGASFTRPVVIGDNILYVQGRGTIVRDLRFDAGIGGLLASGRDLTIYAAHLFAGFTIDHMTYASVPDSVAWCVRSDGVLLGLTYIKEEDVWGWHRHDTDGTFEDVCRLPEGNEDAVYVIVRRTINGVVKRFVERFASRQWATLADAVFMDAAITYVGAPATVIAVPHLVGKTVAVLADGVVPPGAFVVSAGGTITLPVAASTVQVGLPITAELETLDLDVAGSGLRDTKKRVQGIGLLLENSTFNFLAGPDANSLLAPTPDVWDPVGLFTGQKAINLSSRFNLDGRTLIRQTAPLPLTVLGLLPQVEVGG